MNANVAVAVEECRIRAEHGFLLEALHEAAKTSNEAVIILIQLEGLRNDMRNATEEIFSKGTALGPTESGH
jgi:hypothetical protein